MQTLARRARPHQRPAAKPAAHLEWSDFQPALAGGPLTPGGLKNLQRLAGNSAVTGLIKAGGKGPTVQRCGEETHPGCPCASGFPDRGLRINVSVERKSEPEAGADTTLIPLQRAKIDYRDLTWSDFKGKAPKTLSAVTYSDFHPLPKKLSDSKVEDVGSKCNSGKKPTGEYKATVSVDPAALQDVKAFMDQKRSGAKADYKKGLVDRTKTVVKECTKHFAGQESETLADAGKSCLEDIGACRQVFADGSVSFEWKLGATRVEIKEVMDCAKTFLKECKKAHMAETKWGAFSSRDITAENKAACSGRFKTELAAANQTESARLLAHEQLHFNITHSFALGLQAELGQLAKTLKVEETACGKKAAIAKANEAFAALNAKAKLLELWDSKRADKEKAQDAYDDETNHGLELASQKSWNAQFAQTRPARLISR